ncbi:MAG: hypothetical protein RLZZ511_1834 [Cyanobacteriota bacterium]|jgi:hypothetical protein
MSQRTHNGYRLHQLSTDIAPHLPAGSWIAWRGCNFDYEFAAATLAELKAAIDWAQTPADPWELPSLEVAIAA